MNGTVEEGFTFDGMSDSFEDGDITLKFDDGSSLVTHSFILERASPIFKDLLKDCEDGVIQMREVSKDVWIEILRELYPGTHTLFLKQTRTTCSELLGTIAKEARKYVMQALLHTLDVFVAWRIQNTLSTCSSDYDHLLTPFIRLARDYNLERSKQTVVDYVKFLIKQNEETVRRNYKNSLNSPIQLRLHKGVQTAVEIILESGDIKWISNLTRDLCNNIFRMDIKPCE